MEKIKIITSEEYLKNKMKKSDLDSNYNWTLASNQAALFGILKE